jgi:gas vesicle protein
MTLATKTGGNLMRKIFSFLAGALCGLLVGAVAALLMAPMSGEELRTTTEERWQLSRSEARQAMEARRRELEAQFLADKRL